MSDGLSREGFDIDLRFGQQAEGECMRLLLLRAGIEFIEVKADEKARSTGNVFIEYRQRGRPSGIAVTTAQLYAIRISPLHWVWLPTERLKGLARLAYKQRRLACGGDYNRYEGVLVPLEWLVRASQTVRE